MPKSHTEVQYKEAKKTIFSNEKRKKQEFKTEEELVTTASVLPSAQSLSDNQRRSSWDNFYQRARGFANQQQRYISHVTIPLQLVGLILCAVPTTQTAGILSAFVNCLSSAIGYSTEHIARVEKRESFKNKRNFLKDYQTQEQINMSSQLFDKYGIRPKRYEYIVMLITLTINAVGNGIVIASEFNKNDIYKFIGLSLSALTLLLHTGDEFKKTTNFDNIEKHFTDTLEELIKANVQPSSKKIL